MKNIFILMFLFLINMEAKTEIKQLFNISEVPVIEELITEKEIFYGNTSLNENLIEDYTLRFNGYITELNVSENYKKIKKDDLLFEIYSENLNKIKDDLSLINNEKILIKYKSKLRNLNIKEKDINEFLKSKKNTLRLTSKKSGYIFNKKINNGSFVKKGKNLFQIVSLDYIWFLGEIYQKNISEIKIGQKAKIKINNQEFNSKVDYIYPYLNKERKTLKVRFIIENKKNNIYPNMFGKVSIIKKEKKYLTLPKTSVLNKGNKYYIFKKENNEIRPLEITVKRINTNKYQILSGLNKNELVINNILFLFDSDAITNMLYDNDIDEDW